MNLLGDEFYMKQALGEAKLAYEADEVPVGAVIVSNGQIIAKSHNLTETLNDVTAHAEMQAITSAANALGGKYLRDCTLYVTLEPCIMCAGASSWSQIGRIVYGANDPNRGFKRYTPNAVHVKTEIKAGVLEKECAELLQKFFEEKREEK